MMIYCYCEGCKNHDDDDTCKLSTITVSDRDITAAGFFPICQDYEEQDDAVEVVRCKDCKWYGDIGCAIRIFDDTYKPSEHDHCSFAERRQE